jgi:hypothetical protein
VATESPFTPDAPGVAAAVFSAMTVRTLGELCEILYVIHNNFPKDAYPPAWNFDNVIGPQITRLHDINYRLSSVMFNEFLKQLDQKKAAAAENLEKRKLIDSDPANLFGALLHEKMNTNEPTAQRELCFVTRDERRLFLLRSGASPWTMHGYLADSYGVYYDVAFFRRKKYGFEFGNAPVTNDRYIKTAE